MSPSWLAQADGNSPWPQADVVVAGIGVSGFAAADGLLQFGARVTILDDVLDDRTSESGKLLEVLGGSVRLGPGSTATLPDDADLVITTGWPATHPLLRQAAERGVPIWSEVELAWRLSRPDKIVPWLGITGTNGKTTTTQMLESILAAAGVRTAAVGNIGRPIMEFVLDPEPYDVLAVELSSHQLHWSNSLSLHSAAVLNVQPDHLEWHGSYAAYRDAKARIYQRVEASCVYNVADPETERMVEEAEVVEGARAIGFTLGIPAVSMLGVVDDLLVDRAFVEQRRDSALELAKVSDVSPAAPHNVANALAAAALARSYGVPATAVRDGLRVSQSGPPQDSNRAATRWRVLGRRFQGDQSARCRCVAARLRLGGLDRGWPGQGDYLRRVDHHSPGQAAWRRPARHRPRHHRGSARSTRAGSPHTNHRGGRH